MNICKSSLLLLEEEVGARCSNLSPKAKADLMTCSNSEPPALSKAEKFVGNNPKSPFALVAWIALPSHALLPINCWDLEALGAWIPPQPSGKPKTFKICWAQSQHLCQELEVKVAAKPGAFLIPH